ncbi:ATP-dependent exoDNAse (exonuclease V) beta subunit (contains helicase and exonuclease domains) [Prevotellaceae bacterium MN60]|nr:ATP-dependent exoDNAse (exonuclease V) beta subunit (contains helicase and exonuclease domains) [Prevotellaceae bacterium MN60]
MVKPLTVYKASAGSGKTFTLAVEYIKLLVMNPTSYRNILAVTFTNKATEEMKMRILSQLYGISKQLPDSEVYMQRILTETGLPRPIVSKNAGIALHLLLHNYNYFRVETIDSFFQSVLRNLARELDLTANLRISLNDTQVEEQAVDQLIDSLTHTDLMLQWLLSYIMEKISDDHSWNIIGQVKQFGKTIFRDYYKTHSKMLNEKISEKGFIEAYTKQLKALRSESLEYMQKLGEEFFDILESENISITDLAFGKTGVASFFIKLKNGQFDESIVGKRACDCREDPEKWYTKKTLNPEHIHAVAETALIPLLIRAMDERPRKYKIYQSADLTLRHLSQLRLLGSIEQKVRNLNDEANRFLLSDTQQLLHDLISDSDSPFIFEKIGTQLEHVMIDEFQDTSTVQWKNFKVLLQECMSHEGSENLIVGDVKQSIYRWRSGDWRLLNAIDREFPHADDTIEIRPLKVNRRSARNIVNFNNAFFQAAAHHEYEIQREEYPDGAEQLRHAYDDVEQEVPAERDASGYVNIRLLTDDDYQQQTMSIIGDTIRQLQQQGVPLHDIAILVRSNKHIPLIAAYFDENLPDIRIISDEAFRLDASVSICLLIQALHLLTHPDDQLAKGTIVKLYHRSILGESIAESDLLIRDRELDSLLPEEYIKHTSELVLMPLYELVERLYSIFQLERLNEQSAYLCAFYDQLNQFAQDHSSDIDAFIREWEDTICSKTIQSDGADGVRVLSIHKSKGLEFPHVIMPFCDWRLEMPDILWCKPTEAPFDALPLAPIDFSATQMKGTIYEHDYLEEHLQNIVDNLNLLYVAFTRAAQSLYVIGQRGGKSNRSALLEEVLTDIKLEGSDISGADDEGEELVFSYGTLLHETDTPSKKPATANVFLQPISPVQVQLETFENKTEFRQSNKSREFIEGDDEQQELSYIKMGSVLHEIFSTIHTTADIAGALRQLQNDGVLYDDEVTANKLTSTLQKRLKDDRVKSWFSDRWKLFNECSILRLDEQGMVEERRPDRVMTDGKETHVVDFKFGRPRPEYQEQVREYMQLLEQMQMPNVHGWLWYVYSNKIEEVTL